MMCFAWGCKHYSEKHTCSFFRLPRNPKERAHWASLLGRQDRQPSSHNVVCSCHFVDQNRKNGPTIFEPNKTKRCLEEGSSNELTLKKLKTHLVVKEETNDNVDAEEIPGVSPEDSSGTSQILSMPCKFEGTEKETLSKETQINFFASIEAESYFLKQELQEAKSKLEKLTLSFSYDHIKNSAKKVQIYTGFSSNEIFMALFKLLEPYELNYYQGWQVVNMPKIDQLLLTIMKLKLNLENDDLAVRFSISRKTVVNIFLTWLNVLHEIIFKIFMDQIPSCNFPNCRVILDCIEIHCMQSTKITEKRRNNNDEHRNTLKTLIGVAPSGVITYVSVVYPVLVSEKEIVENCGILDQFKAGDLIIADKRFLIGDILPAGVLLNTPPILSDAQVVHTAGMSKMKIQVAKSIRQLKCYKILSLCPANLASHATIICQVCAALTNFQVPLFRESEMSFNDSDED